MWRRLPWRGKSGQTPFIAFPGTLTSRPNYCTLPNPTARRPNGFWDSQTNQREFLEQLERDLNLNSEEDWKKVTTRTLRDHGGRQLLRKYPDILTALRTIFPERMWSVETRKKLPLEFYEEKSLQREIVDSIGKKLGVQDASQWSHVTLATFRNHGGSALLKRYSNSLYAVLSNLYPENKWDHIRTKVPEGQWSEKENVTEFVKKVETHFQMTHPTDWYRVSSKQFQQISGGSTILKQYGTIKNVLEMVYPSKQWNHHLLEAKSKKSSQRELFLMVRSMFPDEEVIEDFLHSGLSRASGVPTELDIFLPARNLAFEFHGEHHYQDIPALGQLELHQTRDKEKVQLCSDHQIKLVVVPYWWDRKRDSLLALMQEYSLSP